MPYVSFLFICLTWGTSFILMERATHALGPVTIATCRLLGGATVLGLYWLLSRQRTKIPAAKWIYILPVGFLSNALPFVVQPYVLRQAGEHAYFGMLVALVPLATILASIAMLGIWPTRRQLIGVLGGMICMAAVVHEGTVRGIDPRLLILALTVPISYAVGNTYVKKYLDQLPPLPLTILFLAFGGLMLLPLQFFPATLSRLNLAGPAEPYDWPVALASITFLSTVGTGVAILLFIRLIKYQGPLFAGMVTYVVPVLALVWGQYDNERLTATQLAAIGGVLAMVALVQWGAAGPMRRTLETMPD